MCSEDVQHEILKCLQAIEDTLSSDQYEISDPFTIGGPTGTYQMESPWNTESEWAIISALAVGTLATTATYAIGSKNQQQALLSGASSFGPITAGRDNNNALPSFVGALTAQAPFVPYTAEYMPLGSPTNIYLVTSTPAASTVLITVLFRRKLARYIPDKPRQQPHTHTHPQSRMHQRKLAAQSTMVAGYEEQYPVAGGKPYSHADPRSVLQQGAAQQQLAPGQDTAVVRKGVFSLGPTGRQRNVRR
jgi:hypothetical protein